MAEVIVIGAGPAGLIAAEHLARAGHGVRVFERLASPARRLLMAGRGGLNLTHSEPDYHFVARYGAAGERIAPLLAGFGPAALRSWADGLGADTFVGSSGRVFPRAMKASPLLRAWLARLDGLGVRIAARHRFVGWGAGGALRFDTPDGLCEVAAPEAVVLALGGQSWPKLGADPDWPARLAACGVGVRAAQPVNCGLRIGWSAHVATRFAGAPLKHVRLRVGTWESEGDAVVTADGLEGGAVYGLGPEVPLALASGQALRLAIDLRPAMALAEVTARLVREGAAQSLANRLRRGLRLAPAAAALLREDGAGGAVALSGDAAALAARIKGLELPIDGTTGLERAISSAGGVAWASVDARMMLPALPGVFVAGEMLDWAAPTGGYLLQASFASGVAAAAGVAAWLGRGS